MIGEKFNLLTPIEDCGRDKRGHRLVNCLCDCGNSKIIRASLVKGGYVKSCGCYKKGLKSKKKEDLTGTKFGRLTVIKELKHSGRSLNSKWVCECECGNVVQVFSTKLKQGTTKSCGCLHREIVTTHALSGDRLYSVWECMIQRCHNPNSPSYKNYGGRGISVDEEWLNSAEAFIAWAKSNGASESLQIDRINNDGDYTPSNCRFVTPYENCHNKRKLMSTNTSGFTGVAYISKLDKYVARITSKLISKNKYIGLYPTAEAAARARNEFIIEHNLPHRLAEI